MSILTEEEIDELDLSAATKADVRDIEAAILKKLAGIKLPWGDDIEAWLEVRTGAEIAAAFHQAYAQGAASQLSAEPVGQVFNDHELSDEWLNRLPIGVKLYTLKEPK